MQNKNLKIKVFGIGSGGQHSVDYLYLNNRSKNIDFIVINSDESVLKQAKTLNKYVLSGEYYSDKGESLGCYGDPETGKKYALKHINVIQEITGQPDVVFLIAGFGGGCGTGATPVIAEMLNKQTIKTIAIVTTPFDFEGKTKMKQAAESIAKIKQYVEKCTVIDNESLREIFLPTTPLVECWNCVDRKVAEEFYRAINNIIKNKHPTLDIT